MDDSPVWSDLATFDGEAWRGKVDIVTAGYPCQPFSLSGRREGEKDPRHLWPAVKRILAQTGTSFLFAENVLGHVSLGLETVRRDLHGMGYGVEAGIFSAAEVGASHLRERLFILAYADSGSIGQLAGFLADGWAIDLCPWEIPTWDAHNSQSLDTALDDGNLDFSGFFPPSPSALSAWEKWLAARPDLQPCLVGSHDGLAGRMDRYRLVGNGVVPLEAAYAFCTLVFDAARKVGAGV